MAKTRARSRFLPEAGPLLQRTDAGDALFLLLRGQRVLLDGVDREFRDAQGLSLALWEVLVILSKAPGMRLPMLDVTRQMLVSKSHVTQLIDKLERAGMVARERTASDRRVIYATLTPAGIEAARRGGDIFNQAARAHFAQHVTASEIRSLVEALSKVISAHEREGGERTVSGDGAKRSSVADRAEVPRRARRA